MGQVRSVGHVETCISHRTAGASTRLPITKTGVREGWRENFVYKLPNGEVVAIYDDVTERKKSEEELRDSERRFRMIYEHAPVMLHSIDRSAVIRNVNKKWLSELGYERIEVLGRTLECFLSRPDSRTRLRQALPQFWRDGGVSDVSYQYERKDGTIIDVLLDSIVVRDMEWGSVSVTVTLERPRSRNGHKRPSVRVNQRSEASFRPHPSVSVR